MKTMIGAFEATSGKLIVTDPCYRRDFTGLNVVVDNVMKGTWQAFITVNEEGRATQLEVCSEGVIVDDALAWEVVGTMGVDSGQAGIFEESLYPEDPGRWDGGGGFYDRACNANFQEERAEGGIIAEGVVCPSGYGDGGYAVRVARFGAVVVGIKIVFIGDPLVSDEDCDEPQYDDDPEDFDDEV